MHLLRLICLGTAMALFAALPLRAQTLIRDADIEYALSQIGAPVIRAAGLSPKSVRILVVKDDSLNAFVADTQHIFLHSGLLLRLKTAEAVQAVIAHEAAHISNGHLTRRVANMRNARTAAGLGMVLAAAAAASGGGQAAAGLAIGSQSAAMRGFLSHTRAEESSADLSSFRMMVRAGVDPRGALEVHELFKGQEALSARRQDPYMRSHPLTRDRMRAMEGLIASSNRVYEKDPTTQYWFARVRGKLSAFTRAPNWTLRRLKDSGSQDIALMREAIAYHRQSNLKKALAAIDKAIALRPKDPFLRELKGQILLESRQFKAAVQTYGQAVNMAGSSSLILGGYGRALLADGRYGDALKALETARARDFRDARILRDLAVAYARQGNNGMASLVTAERYALQGRLKDATIHATRAEGLLPRGSGGWNRALDVLNAAKSVRR